MNNSQFRRLVLDTPARSNNDPTPKPSTSSSTLGSKKSSFIPMTPRTVKGGGAGVDFARQVAERTAASLPTKKFKSSAAPRGSKLAAGFRDRTLDRLNDDEQAAAASADDRAERIKALEEQVKLGQLDYKVFESLRDQITGGEVGATHLVKGLDRKLLERVRKGEDVLSGVVAGEKGEQKEEEVQMPEVDDEFEKLEEKEVETVEKEKAKKKGEMAAPPPPPPQVAGAKRSRDAILAELKAQRKAAAEARIAARPDLGDRFRSIDKPKTGPRIAKDAKGREVLITVDESGKVKKKVRKAVTPVDSAPVAPAKPIKHLDEGTIMWEPKQKAPVPEKEDSEDDDIFADVGAAYDPLGEEDNDQDSDDELVTKPTEVPSPYKDEDADEDDEGEIPEDSDEPENLRPPPASITTGPPTTSMPPPPAPAPPSSAPAPPRNYFKTALISTSSEEEGASKPQGPMSDPSFLAAIKRAGSLANFRMNLSDNSSEKNKEEMTEEEQEARLRKRAAMLASSDRDLEDMDLGFGSSRFGDDEEGEEDGGGPGGKKVKLSEWKGVGAAGDDEDGEDGGGKGGAGGKRKRGPKKRKGDKESIKDVLGVLERRKEGK